MNWKLLVAKSEWKTYIRMWVQWNISNIHLGVARLLSSLAVLPPLAVLSSLAMPSMVIPLWFSDPHLHLRYWNIGPQTCERLHSPSSRTPSINSLTTFSRRARHILALMNLSRLLLIPPFGLSIIGNLEFAEYLSLVEFSKAIMNLLFCHIINKFNSVAAIRTEKQIT